LTGTAAIAFASRFDLAAEVGATQMIIWPEIELVYAALGA
jgi:hypothetical protein